MATRIEIAEAKLHRLEAELNAQMEKVFGHTTKTNGQPMNDKRGGKSFFKRQNQLEDKAFRLNREIQEQIERVEQLRHNSELAELGLDRNGNLIKSVKNLGKWKERVELHEYIRDYNKSHGLKLGTPLEIDGQLEWYSSSKYKVAKETVAMLENMVNETEQATEKMSEKANKLIETGAVTQWAKKPIFYFVKGLKKVALVIDNEGNFCISKQYPAKTEDELSFVETLLAG